ncbi:MAG TPA: cytochrome c maturation protein CcmE, partial [Brevibacterium sp.]|nr:cytochrome c maturation protein CcmE [Brevibacterium sp.]
KADTALVGERVQVGGRVVAGSFDPKQLPMEFSIVDENDEGDTGPSIRVTYDGAIPSAFGDGVTAIVTGTLHDDSTMSADQMITKCPSKYESADGAMTPKSLLDIKDSMVGQEQATKVVGAVTAGTIKGVDEKVRFEIHSEGVSLPIVWDGALPEGMTDDSPVVVTGHLNADGTFTAVDVANQEL